MSAKLPTRRVRIRGRWWRIIIGRPPANKCDGYCRYSTRTIWINHKTNEAVRIMIHEVLHACFPDLEETAVLEAEDAIASAISLLLGQLP